MKKNTIAPILGAAILLFMVSGLMNTQAAGVPKAIACLADCTKLAAVVKGGRHASTACGVNSSPRLKMDPIVQSIIITVAQT